ncbi:MAG TPA: hypothetical protein VFR70_10510 [Flavobacterium sp.]|nr:hypothetical protein [Flavobacterium sp.]
MKKVILILILFSICASCKKKKEGENKNIYYKTISDDSRILDYRLRSYRFIGDTIEVKEIILTKDKEFYFNNDSFLKKNEDLFILSKDDNSVIVEPYLTVQKLDSCNYVKHPFGDYKFVMKGEKII